MEYINRYLYPYNEDWYLNNDFFVPNLGEDKVLFYNKGTITLKQFLSNNNFLFIVGERQSGKTTYLKHYWNIINNDKKFWVNFDNFLETEFQLENISAQLEQQNNKEIIYIFIDNLHNCTAKIQERLYNLVNLLTKYNTKYIKLIIASDIFSIPFDVIDTIKNIFKIENETNIIYKLTPFSYADIEAYVGNNLKFKNALLYKFNFFLTNTQTINEMKNILDNNNFSQKDLYEYLIKVSILKSKKSSENQLRSLVLEQILYILGYIAYNQLKYNKLSISFQIEYNNENLNIHDINIGREIYHNEMINLSEIDFENLLCCNLFFKENNLYKFKNNDIRNYLAAYYLYYKSQFTKNFDYRALIEIDEYIVPIFSEVASWLSILDEQYFNKSIEKNSYIFLKSTILYNDKQNRILIDKAIELLYDGKITYYDIKSDKLIYPEITKQIKNILNNNINNEIKLFCISLISDGRLLDFQSWLFSQIKDKENDIAIRGDALRALQIIGNNYWKHKVCRLYDQFVLELSNLNFDERDHFRGSVLNFYINTSISVKKIIQLITPEKQANYGGRYAFFLHSIVDNYINEFNICEFLKLIDATKLDNKDFHIKHFYEKIINKSLEYIDNKKVLKIVSNLIYKYLKNNHYCFNLDIELLKTKNEITRNIFVYITTNLLNKKDKDTTKYLFYSLYDRFMNYEDFLWLCELYKKEDNKYKKNKLKNLINLVRNDIFPQKLTERTKEYFLQIYNEFNQDSILIETFGKFNTRIYKHKLLSWEKKKLNEEKFDNIKYIEENYRKAKDDFRYADYLIRYLTLSDSKIMGNLSFLPDNYPAWTKSNKELQNRILNTFYEYLKNITIPNKINEEYIKGTSFQPVWFSLVFVEEMLHRKLITVKDAKKIAEKWVIYIFLMPNFDDDYKPLQNIIEFYYKLIPNILVKTLKKIVKLSVNKRYPHILTGFENIYNDELNNILLDLLKPKYNLNIDYKIHIIKYLKSRLPHQSEKYVRKLFKNSSIDEEKIKYGNFMLTFESNSSWEFLLKHIQNQFELGRAIISNHMMYNLENTISCLDEDLIAQYYIWLYEAYPYEEEEEYRNSHLGFVHTTTDKDNLSHFRNELLRVIRNNGYYNAMKLIKRKIPQLGQERWFKIFEFNVFNNSNSAKLLGYNSFLSSCNIEDNNIVIYVESDNDKKFYETIYEKISRNPNKYNFSNDYNFEFKSFGNDGGCNKVKNIIEQSLKQGKINVFGILDKDGGKNINDEHILVTTRYSMENYLMDPILLLHLLSSNPNVKGLYKKVNNNLKTKYNISLENINVNCISENDLIEKYCPVVIDEICKNQNIINQCIPEIVTQGSYYHNEYIKIKYYNGLTINVPRWVSENKGHNVVKVLNRYNQYWTEQFLLAKLKDIDIICIDVIDLFKQIIEKYCYILKYL